MDAPLPRFFTNNSLQYHDTDNQGLGFFLLSGTFSGPSHPNIQGLAVVWSDDVNLLFRKKTATYHHPNAWYVLDL